MSSTRRGHGEGGYEGDGGDVGEAEDAAAGSRLDVFEGGGAIAGGWEGLEGGDCDVGDGVGDALLLG